MTEVERLAERLLDLVSNFTKESYRETLTNSAALIRSQAEELERLRSDITRQMAIANSECNRAERMRGALGEIEEGKIERPLGSAYRADGTPSKHDLCIHGVWMYMICESCIDAHVRAALEETKAAPEQEPSGA